MYGISQRYSILPAPIPVLYILFFGMLSLLFYLEGLMICIVATQYWNPEDFKATHPRAYQLHKIVNAPDTVKKFIVGRQFFTLVTNFILAQVCVFPLWPSEGYNPVLFFILIRSGLVGVMIILAFAQLLPELLAARHPLAFMNFYGSTAIVQMSLFIDAIGVGHCACSFSSLLVVFAALSFWRRKLTTSLRLDRELIVNPSLQRRLLKRILMTSPPLLLL